MNPKVKKGLNIASWVLIVLFFVFAVILIVYSISFRQSGQKAATLFGNYHLNVLSDSMEPEFYVGDMVVVKKAKTDADKASYEIGQIITFEMYADPPHDNTLIWNTHEIVDFIVDEGGRHIGYVTQGLNQSEDDPDYPIQELVYFDEVQGVYRYNVRGFGAVMNWLSKPLGMGLIIVLPLLAYFVYRLIVVIKLVLQINTEKKGTLVTADLESMKLELEKLRAQLGVDDTGNDTGGAAAITAPVVTEAAADATTSTETGEAEAVAAAPAKKKPAAKNAKAKTEDIGTDVVTGEPVQE